MSTEGFHTPRISYQTECQETSRYFLHHFCQKQNSEPLNWFPKSEIMGPWIYPVTSLTSFGSLRNKSPSFYYQITKSKQPWFLNNADRQTLHDLLDVDMGLFSGRSQNFGICCLRKTDHTHTKIQTTVRGYYSLLLPIRSLCVRVVSGLMQGIFLVLDSSKLSLLQTRTSWLFFHLWTNWYQGIMVLD